ncbi:MAG: ABC transporter permease [Coriobacteriia bacterium]|nr:ABC transporter permease [Coriobacteriia bacterium]
MTRFKPFIAPVLGLTLYLAIAAAPAVLAGVLGALFPGETRVLYPDATPLELVWQHVRLVGISSALSVLIGLGMGVFVTRPAGADYFDVVTDLTNLGQTFPPVAVFTLAVPLLGFGLEPTVLALTLYGVLPVLRNTVAGLTGLSSEVIESADGMGMRPAQRLLRVELPLAAPLIMAGVRISVIVNVATATIGAVANAGGLGAPIINGLVNLDPAVTLEGAVLVAGLALILDAFLVAAERVWDPAGRLRAA